MKQSKFFSRVLMLTALAALVLSSAAIAGNPGSEITIEGPEYWGVIVADCNTGMATLRVKKIDNCDVVTESKAFLDDTTLLCPDSAAAVLSNPALYNITLFGDQRTPVITKVKNHKNEDGTLIYSMDVQIKFIK